MDKTDSMIQAFHESGFNDDQIMNYIITSFENGKMSIDELELMVERLGFSLTDEFYQAHNLKR